MAEIKRSGEFVIERVKKGIRQTKTYTGDRLNIPTGWRVIRVIKEY